MTNGQQYIEIYLTCLNAVIVAGWNEGSIIDQVETARQYADVAYVQLQNRLREQPPR